MEFVTNRFRIQLDGLFLNALRVRVFTDTSRVSPVASNKIFKNAIYDKPPQCYVFEALNLEYDEECGANPRHLPEL